MARKVRPTPQSKRRVSPRRPATRPKRAQRSSVSAKARRGSVSAKARPGSVSAKARQGRVSAKAREAAEQRASAVFEQQIDPLWQGLAHQCLQFAEGFNSEIRAHLLQVESNPDTIVAKFASGGEVLFQLDRTLGHIACWISSGCAPFGSCIVEQPSVSLTIQDGELRFVYGATVMTPDDLAVKVLTDLVQPEPEAEEEKLEAKT
jgi:hypothetical protein